MGAYWNNIWRFIKGLFAGHKQQEDTAPVQEETLGRGQVVDLHEQIKEEVEQREPIIKPINGSDTQFAGASSKDFTDIVIGFDFGTCSTKVVLRDLYGGRVFAVPFNTSGRPDSQSYLLPTRLFIMPDGRFAIQGADNDDVITNLKLHFIENNDKVIWNDDGIKLTAADATAFYMACVLQYVRLWFFKNCNKIYGSNTIRWYLNVGLPTVNYEDEDLVKRYKSCISMAWNLSIEKSPLEKELARSVSNNHLIARENRDIRHDAINVYPEVAAAVTGYARSNMRESGLHLLVDIGAGTFDVSTFNLLQNDGMDTYAFFETDVRYYGAFANHKRRLKTIDGFMRTKEDKAAWKLWKASQVDPTKPVPKTLNDYIQPLRQQRITKLTEVQKSLDCHEKVLRDKAELVVRMVVGITKMNRDPRSRQWAVGLPVFLCGGGSDLQFYRDVISSAEHDLKAMDISRFVLKKLPKPDNLIADGLDTDSYHRIYVALGLSYPYEEIGRIIPTHDIEDIDRHLPHRQIPEAPTQDDV